MVAGGWKRERQVFSRPAAEANAGMLSIAVAAMLVPAIFHFAGERMHDNALGEHDHRVSIAASVVLLLVYAAGLLFTLRTHAHLLSRPPAVIDEVEEPATPHAEVGRRRRASSCCCWRRLASAWWPSCWWARRRSWRIASAGTKSSSA